MTSKAPTSDAVERGKDVWGSATKIGSQQVVVGGDLAPMIAIASVASASGRDCFSSDCRATTHCRIPLPVSAGEDARTS